MGFGELHKWHVADLCARNICRLCFQPQCLTRRLGPAVRFRAYIANFRSDPPHASKRDKIRSQGLNPHSPDEPLNCTALTPIQI